MSDRDKAMADAVLATGLMPSELQRRHEHGDHRLCPDHWCAPSTGADG